MKNVMVKDLLKRSRKLYPASKPMRFSWVRQTKRLIETGSHMLQTGRFKTGRG